MTATSGLKPTTVRLLGAAAGPRTTARMEPGLALALWEKLVITPAQPIPNGTTFKVVINYTGQPGIRSNPSLGSEGWFRNNSPVGDGAMVTNEPSGSMAWMPLNNQASVKPTYDVHSTVNYDPALAPEANRVFIGPGRLVSTVVNEPDANYPVGGSRTFNWHSAEPIGSYLV